MTFIPAIDSDIEYPDSDGKPMADNTEQYEWIVKIKENLEILFANSPQNYRTGCSRCYGSIWSSERKTGFL